MRKIAVFLVYLLVLSTFTTFPYIVGAQDPSTFNLERPSDDIDLKERVENAYTDGQASVGIGIGIDAYVEEDVHYEYADSISLNVSMSANSRKGITYSYYTDSLFWIDENDLWYRTDYNNVGDDWGTWIDFPDAYSSPFYFRFYGGRGSGEYSRVWVCTNGFLAFDDSESTSANPSDIPTSTSPNAIIAALWTDLEIDNQASIITGQYVFLSRYYFVIIWKNARHKASNERLTFSVILQDAPKEYPVDTRYSQSMLWISYNGVNSINTDFTNGIEDHQGEKGTGGIHSGGDLGSYDGYTLYFYQLSNSYFLKKLTLHFQDLESDTEFNIWEGENGFYLRGHNIQRNWDQPSEPDTTYMSAIAFAGTAVLLYSAYTFSGGTVAAACILVDTVLVALDLGEVLLAYNQYSGKQVEVFDLEDSSGNQATAEAFSYDYAVDATLSILVDWVLKTPNNIGDHTLTITAELEYYEYSIITGEIIEKDPITTSVDLNVGPDDNNSFPDSDIKSTGWHHRLYIGGYDTDDYYKFEVDIGYKINVYLELISEQKADVDIYIYDPGQTEKSKETLTGPPYDASLSCSADSTGYWFLRVHLLGSFGFYSFRITVTPNTAPQASNLQISPTAPVSTDDLVGSYDYYDADDDPQSGSEIHWYMNGALQPEFNNMYTVLYTATSVGEVWHFTVRPKDGKDFGDLETSPSVTIAPTHDVAVTDIMLLKTIVGQNFTMEINVTIEDQGDFPETFNVQLYVFAWIVDSVQVTLDSGENQTVTFTWNTIGYAYGDYVITAYAVPVTGETETDNNLLTDGSVLVTIPGDVDGDHDVDIFDMTMIASAYNSQIGDPDYIPNCDIDGDGDIDIFDVVIAAGNYGQSW